MLAPRIGAWVGFDESQPFPVFRLAVPLSRSLPSRLLQTAMLGIRGASIAKGNRARAILFGHWYLAAAGPLVQTVTRLPYGVFLHGGELDEARGAARQGALRAIARSSLVIVNSEHTRHELLRHVRCHPLVAKVSPGVDTLQFHPGVNAAPVKRRHGLEERRVLLTVARLVERKGHDTVIEALPTILERFPDVVYLIVGDGPMRSRLAALARDVGVADRVIFAGEVADDQLPAYYSACHLFVMPSRRAPGREGTEGFGIVYLEANACGKPVVGGRSGGVADAIEEGVTGLLVDPLDARSLAGTVTRLLGDEGLMEKLGTQGRRRAELEFDWRVQACRLDRALDSMWRG